MKHRGTLIICEGSGRWAAALRLAFIRGTMSGAAPEAAAVAKSDARAREPRIIETRLFSECLESLAAAPQAIVAVELHTANCSAQLGLIRKLRDRFAGVPVVALAARELADYQWVARELGAIHFTISPRKLAAVVELARRYWDRLPVPRMSTIDAIRAALPWE